MLNPQVADAPHTGMLGGGNDNLFEGNLFSDLGYESRDTGAFYSGRCVFHFLCFSPAFKVVVTTTAVYCACADLGLPAATLSSTTLSSASVTPSATTSAAAQCRSVWGPGAAPRVRVHALRCPSVL